MSTEEMEIPISFKQSKYFLTNKKKRLFQDVKLLNFKQNTLMFNKKTGIVLPALVGTTIPQIFLCIKNLFTQVEF